MRYLSNILSNVIATPVSTWLDATANMHSSTLASRNYHVKHCDTAKQTQ